MAYTPPSYDAVNITFTSGYTVPEYNEVNPYFGIPQNEVEIYNNIINLVGSISAISPTDVISVGDSLIDLSITESVINPLLHINPYNVIIDVTTGNLAVVILPDIVNPISIIDIFYEDQDIEAGQPHNLPNNIKSIFNGFSWGGVSSLDVRQSSSYGTGFVVDVTNRLPHTIYPALDTTSRYSWGTYFYVDINDRLSNKSTVPLDVKLRSPWASIPTKDISKRFLFTEAVGVDTVIRIPYSSPEPKDKFITIPYEGLADTLDKVITVPWASPYPKDVSHRTYWGPKSYMILCGEIYYAPRYRDVDVYFGVWNRIIQVPYNHVNLVFTPSSTASFCPYENKYTGHRDTPVDGIEIIIREPAIPSVRGVYYMLNTVLVKRLPDNIQIEILGLNAKLDQSSWLWQFDLIIGKRAYLNLIKPNINNSDIFYDIDIYINGWHWTCRVESYSENKGSLGFSSWTVTGRSPSMELGSPQNPPTSFVYDPNGSSETAGGQIIDDVLEGTMLGLDQLGWTADWSFYNDKVGAYSGFDVFDGDHWGIPANTFSWQNMTQIDVISQLTASIGVYVQTYNNCYSDKRLIMKPLFSTPPWHWNNFNDSLFPEIDHVLPDSTFMEVGRQYQSLPSYNAVYVMGQSVTSAQKTNLDPGVVFVNAYRYGFSGSNQIHAPNVSNQWLTSWMSCREYGRMVISNTGEWLNHTIKLFSLAQFGTTGSGLSGLVLPGEFVQVYENSANWYGMVTGTTISVSISGKSAWTVSQTINVKQYVGE